MKVARLVVPLILCLSSVAQAQIPRHRLIPPDGSGTYSRMAVFASDVNADGISDIIVGDPYAQPKGKAYVHSGRDGELLYTFEGNHTGSQFGRSVAAGDVNGDGLDDLVVGGPLQRHNSVETGAVKVFSGKTGKFLYKFPGPVSGSLAGYSVTTLDANLDGYSDVVVGSPGIGCVDVYSGFDGSLLWQVDKFFGEFGSIVARAGDVDADGTEDLLVAAGTIWVNGGYSAKAYVYSGRTGKQLHKFETASKDDWFAFALASAGDVDGDGQADLAVAAVGHDGPFPTAGRVDVYSGRTWARLLTMEGTQASEEFGKAVAPAGDLNQDGHDDILVTSKRPGRTGVYSGLDGSQLLALGETFSAYWEASAGGDLDGDGRGDLLVADVPGGVFTYLTVRALGIPTCAGITNSTGIAAALHAQGSAEVAANDVLIRGAYLPPGALGVLLASRTPGLVSQPGGSQGTLCLGGQIARWSHQPVVADAGGATLQRLDLTSIPSIPPHAVMAGETWYFQHWYRDQNPDATSNFTGAFSLMFH